MPRAPGPSLHGRRLARARRAGFHAPPDGAVIGTAGGGDEGVRSGSPGDESAGRALDDVELGVLVEALRPG